MKDQYPDLVAQIGNNPNVVFVPKFREFGILIADGGSSYWVMKYCPWTGKKLPPPLRDEWFERIWALGYEVGDEGIPDAYECADWWEMEHL